VSSQDDVTSAGTERDRAANQGKTEPMPPTAGHSDPDSAPAPATVEEPDLDSMSVGARDPQAPSHPAAAGVRAASPTEAAPRPQVASGTAFRAPGSVGVEGADEQIDTAMETSAARTNVAGTPGTAAGTGDAQSVPVGSEEASPGTSEQSSVAQGSRTPL
jgi:hypothetical protein